MAEMTRVKLADMRPDPKNPRREFNGLEELAASFAFTPDRPGEPVSPPIVVADGNVYRIVDGERRYRAMCKFGTPDNACLCVVFDDFGEASSVAAMMATDAKEALTDEERSVGVQQMLLLGVPEETADKLSRSREGSAAKVRRAMCGAGKPVQLTMGRMFEIAEIDDAERRAELVKLAENDGAGGYSSPFNSKLRYYSGEQKVRAERAAYMDALASIGVEPLGCHPDAAEWSLRCQAWSVKDLEDKLRQFGESGCEWCVHVPEVREPNGGSSYWDSVRPTFYVRRDGGDADDGREARRERAAAFDASLEEAKARRLGFVAGLIADGSISSDADGADRRDLRDFMKNSVEAFFRDHWYAFSHVAAEGSEVYLAAVSPRISSYDAWMVPLLMVNLEPLPGGLFEVCAEGAKASTFGARAGAWEELFEALVKAGYDPSDFERDVIERLTGEEYGAWREALV